MVKKAQHCQTLIVVVFFFSQVSLAQKESEQFFKNPLVPGNKKNTQKDLLKLDSTSIDEFINYFSEKRKTPSYKYYNEGDNKTWIVSILDPVEFFRQEIEKSLTEKRNISAAYEPSDNIGKLSYRIDKLNKSQDILFKNTESDIIRKQIDLLPPTKEKVSLAIKYSSLKINNRNYYYEIEETYKKIEKIIVLIPDKYEKATALFYFGNFLVNYGANSAAISIYFKARENVYNSNKPDSVKNQMQGVLCEQIGLVFSSETITLSVMKSFEYYLLAIRYYQLAEKKDDIERASLNILGYWLYRGEEIKALISDDVLYESILKQYLFGMQMWLDEYDVHPSNNNAVNYHGAYCIAIACRNHKKFKTSINYFIEALYYAIKQKNYILVRSSISNISSMYGELNEWDLADRYIKLLSLFEPTWKNLSIFNKGMQQGEAYRNLNKLDIALMAVNQVQFDTALMNSFFPPFARKRYQEINNLKFSILSKLKDDSAHIYENYCHYDQEFYQDQFSQILIAESKAISEWLEHQGEKELTIREELIKTKEENNKILSKQNSFLDSLSTFNFLLSNLRKDSIIREREYRKKDSIYYTDTLAKAEAIRSLTQKNAKADSARLVAENESEKARARIKANRLYLIIGLVSFASIVSILLFISWGKRRTIRHKLDRARADMKLLSTLAVNHDIDKFIKYMPEYAKSVNDKTKDKFVSAVKEFAQYHYVVKNIGNQLTNTVKAEIEIARKSAPVYFYLSETTKEYSIETNFDSDSEIENLVVPKHFISSFIANSIKHGSLGRNQISIWVRAIRIPNGFFFEIEDNGTGFEDLNLEGKKQDKGINLCTNQVLNFNDENQEYQIEFEPKNVQNKKTGDGVLVSFKLLEK